MGVVELVLVKPTPLAKAWGRGLPLGNLVDVFIGGGICALPTPGLCRASMVPFIWIEPNAGDCA